jgi:ketosteroid isomerase-like protein
MSETSVFIREPRRWLQFSLKALMLLVLLSAMFLSGWSVAFRKAQEAEAMARREAEMARMAELQARYIADQQAAASQILLEQARQQSANPTSSPGAATDDLAAAIEDVLRLQAEAWNAGDIDRFMDHYWKSDELTFSAGGQTTRGWQNTLDRYRQRYPTTEKMGNLTFDELEIQPLNDSAALVLGQWHLKRDADSLDGNFSLIVRKIDGRWRIVHDHTSRAEKPPAPPAGETPCADPFESSPQAVCTVDFFGKGRERNTSAVRPAAIARTALP